MKTIRRLTVLTGTVALAGTLLSPSALAATGVLPDGATAGNGRDHGWGNCGYNNGNPDTRLTVEQLRQQTGLGGYSKQDALGGACGPSTPASKSVVESESTASSGATGSSETTDSSDATDVSGDLTSPLASYF